MMNLDLIPPAELPPGVAVALAGDMPTDDFDLALDGLLAAAAALTATIAGLATLLDHGPCHDH
jgi:hypothetical protein